ncbi:MAG: hypothetical protein ACRDZ4_03835 [Egibacteraceae bacterium]
MAVRHARSERVKLSAEVFVLYADDESFTFMTPEGHGLAGWITFSAFDREGVTAAQAQILMRATDPKPRARLALSLHRWEDLFWQHTLTALATHFGIDGQVDTEVVCVDRKRRWRKAGNVRHNAAIRSGRSATGTPFRRPGRRERPVDA